MAVRHARPARLAIGVSLGLLAGCTPQRGQAPTPPAIVEPAPGATGLPASGHAAIAPSGPAGITDAEVRAFVLSHRVPAALQASDVAILSTSFVTAQEVRARLHSARLGLPDDAPLCLVVLSGRFVFSGPPGQTPTFPYGIEVFDARTGNLIQSGGMPRVPEGR
jgi:hypothetical protein